WKRMRWTRRGARPGPTSRAHPTSPIAPAAADIAGAASRARLPAPASNRPRRALPRRSAPPYLGDVEPLTPPVQQLGPYRLVRELGRGGQGQVWLAEDLRLKRKVALKVMTHLGPGSEPMLARFRREAEVASRLDHPGICGVHDTGVDSGVAWIA